MLPSTEGRDANQITSLPFTPDSTGHIHSSLSWRDYAERNKHPVALLYSALHLRLCIEHLWFEIFQASSGNVMSDADYQRAVAEATKLYKLVDSRTPYYDKFCEFGQLIASLDTIPHPPTIIWDITRLKRIHGESSGRFLHFQGDSNHGAFSEPWITEQNRFLKEHGEWIWNNLVTRGNLFVFRPDKLNPETFAIWEDFCQDKIDSESAYIRLKIIQGVLTNCNK